jgi:hypothetical protein
VGFSTLDLRINTKNMRTYYVAIALIQFLAAPLFALDMRVNACAGMQPDRPGRIQPKPPRVFIMDGEALAALREAIAEKPEDYQQSMELLRREADAYLNVQPWTITTKTLLPPSGDKHDYESQGPYWWPNPDTKDGLPYIRRDGEKNPETEKLTDHHYLSEMTQAVKTLSLAYFLTANEAYAEKTALFLRTWFIDPRTRMNPHLQYGQRIPGRTEGRDIGIIETRNLGQITDAVGLVEKSRSWSRAHQQGMEKWMSQYLAWLLNSEHGKGEARQRNNHGTWYDVQVAAPALFTRQEDVARQALMRARDQRLPGHIKPDGSQPHELARTRSWNYSVTNLESFFTLAALGEKVGLDLWNYTTPDGRNIIEALDFLVQYADPKNPKPWTHKQITEMSPKQIIPLLYQAACRFPDREYDELAAALEEGKSDLNPLLYPCAAR